MTASRVSRYPGRLGVTKPNYCLTGLKPSSCHDRNASTVRGGGRRPGTLRDERWPKLLHGSGGLPDVSGEYLEHKCWYPKDSELCLARMKPGETLVEVRSDSDVQIDRQSWV